MKTPCCGGVPHHLNLYTKIYPTEIRADIDFKQTDFIRVSV